MKKYSFTVVVRQYDRKNCVLDDMRVIYCGNTCIAAKNAKHGELYLHKNAKIIKGNFYHNAGSIRSPILFAQREVHIRVTDFHMKAEIVTDQNVKQDIISIIDENY